MSSRVVRRSTWALLIAFLVVLSACSDASDSASEGTDGESDAVSSSEESEEFPVTVEDCNGLSFTYDEAPERLVPLSATAMEFLYWLEVEDRIAGTGEEPTGQVFPEQFREHAESVEALADPFVPGETYLGVTFETLLAADGDFVFTDFESTFASFSQEDLQEREIPSYFAFSVDCAEATNAPQTTLDLVYRDIENLGAIVGAPAKADEIVAEMEADVADVQERLDDLSDSDRPTVWLMIADNASDETPGPARGNRNVFNAIAEQAGGKNAFADADEGLVSGAGWEDVANTDPDVILMAAYGYGGPEDFDSAIEEGRELLQRNPAMRNLDAVTEDRILTIDYWLLGGGSVRNADAIVELAEGLHPDAFS